MNHRTRDGQILKISEMTDKHLQNTIALKQRQLKPYLDEATKRGISPLPPFYLRLWYWGKRNFFRLTRTSKRTKRPYEPMIEEELFEDSF